MFVRSNGKIRLTDETYASWLRLVTFIFPGVASIFFVLSLIWETFYFSILFGIFSISSFLMGSIMLVSSIRRETDTGAYDGLVSVIPATEDRAKQVIFRLYKGPEALDKARSVSFKVDHGAIPIVEFDDDDVDLEDDEEEPRK